MANGGPHMKFLHLADLHLGKRIGEYDLYDVQSDILSKIVKYVEENMIPTVVIAGDVYDTRDPSASATRLLDDFLSELNRIHVNVLMISGNHDQEDKLHFGSSILRNSGIHIVTNIKDSLTPVTIDDVNFYLLPFVNRYDVHNAFRDETKDFDTLGEAISYVIGKMNIDKTKKNVLVSHQGVLGSGGKLYASGSEVSVEKDKDGAIGGEDIISSSVYKDFDYVALGHIHKKMNVEKNMRYPGALLKYHKDEANNDKTFTIVNTDDFSIEEIKIPVLRDVRVLKGPFEDVRKHYEFKSDYVFFELTDTDYVHNPMERLKKDFPYACGISYPSKKISTHTATEKTYEDVDKISKVELFNNFYKIQMDEEMNEEQKKMISAIVKEIWGE